MGLPKTQPHREILSPSFLKSYMRNQIVILAAGKGTRMGSDMPKVLVMLKNKPLILHLLGELENISQLIKPVVVVGYRSSQVKSVLGEGFLYAYQEQQLGTGHALMCAETKVNAGNILVLYGDMPFIKAESIKRLLKLHHERQAVMSMFTASVENFANYPSLHKYGRIIRSAHGNIVKITEYKDATESERGIREVNPGIYMFKTEWLWQHIGQLKNLNAQQEYYLTDMVEVALADGQDIESLQIHPSEVVGINTQDELAAAERFSIQTP